MYGDFSQDQLINIYRKMYLCRQFEYMVVDFVKQKKINSPVYLSVGQESVPASLSENKVFKNNPPAIFAQHRAHSYFLCFGGKPEDLIQQIMGARGSPSISNPAIKMFGHSGLLGDQVPIAVGYAQAKNEVTLCVFGDGAAEEDYCLGALGHAITHNCPVLFICEDNNLSILTPKSVRRSWSIENVALGMGMWSDKVDHFVNLDRITTNNALDIYPALINVNTERHLWHAGIGKDKEPQIDILSLLKNHLTNSAQIPQIEQDIKEQINEIARHY